MSVGSSGRIVIEIEPDLKKELYCTLKKDGLSMKEWFLNRTSDYLVEDSQINLSLNVENNDTQEALDK